MVAVVPGTDSRSNRLHLLAGRRFASAMVDDAGPVEEALAVRPFGRGNPFRLDLRTLLGFS